MISSYRLGDLILLNLTKKEKYDLYINNPNTLGHTFMTERINGNRDNKIDLITKLVIDYTEKNKHLLPEDIEDCTVIHLRLGDVVSGNEWHEKLKRPINIEDMHVLLQNDNNKKYVIGKCFFAKTSSNNYEQCIEDSNHYLNNILNEFNAIHFDSGNPDLDLCCAVKAKQFIQGKGFFSKLIVEIRKTMNLSSIEISELLTKKKST